MANMRVWQEYLDFVGLEQSVIRAGNEPRLFLDKRYKNHAIVLVHGLTDSPYTMEAIGRYFHEEMGFNVYLPLLAGHGLVNPPGMREVTLKHWIDQVDFALYQAHAQAKQMVVSIGGLSTGGALSTHRVLFSNQVNGGLFLFSAALRLAGAGGRIGGSLKESALGIEPLRRYFADRTEPNTFIGPNPIRYARMDLDGAAQLGELLRIIDQAIADSTITMPVFVAHSEADQSASIRGVEALLSKCTQSEFFRIGKDFHVPHASVILKEPVFASNGSPMEPANPFFDIMMECVQRFAQEQLLTTR